jgi:type II secretion system protein G
MAARKILISLKRNLAMTTKAFTLIELLIVVAIIAILAAIAVPNFLEAQTRSKVSRAKSDMRSINTAIEAYRVDTNAYPVADLSLRFGGLNSHRFYCLTTPISYITSVPQDPFISGKGALNQYWDTYLYWDDVSAVKFRNFPATGPTAGDTTMGLYWDMYSIGPNYRDDLTYWYSNPDSFDYVYDPTNGTVSTGNIFRLGPIKYGRHTKYVPS